MSKIQPVKTTKIATATRIVRASFFEAIGIEDPLPPESRTLLMSPKEAERVSGLSRSTIDRMIYAGRHGVQAEAA